MNLRITKDFREFIVNEAAKRNMKQKEFVIQAIQEFVNPRPEKEVLGPGLKAIITKYPGQCSKCGDPIPIGSQAWYGKRQKGSRPILICLNCMVKGMGDRALAKRYLKTRELQITIKGLKKIADELCESLFDPGLFEKSENFQRVVSEAVEHYAKYLKAAPGEEQVHLTRFLDLLRNAERISKGLDDFLELQIQRLRKVKKEPIVV